MKSFYRDKLKSMRWPIIAFLYFVPLALVQAIFHVGTAPGGRGSGGLQNPLKGGGINSIAEFFEKLLQILILLAYPVIVLFMVYAGFLFITAQGSEEKLNTAKKIFLWTVIGALIVLGAQALLIAIKGTVTEIIQGRAPIELSRPLAEENPINIERRV